MGVPAMYRARMAAGHTRRRRKRRDAATLSRDLDLPETPWRPRRAASSHYSSILQMRPEERRTVGVAVGAIRRRMVREGRRRYAVPEEADLGRGAQ